MNSLYPLQGLTQKQIAWAREKNKLYDMSRIRALLVPPEELAPLNSSAAQNWLDDKLVALAVESEEDDARLHSRKPGWHIRVVVPDHSIAQDNRTWWQRLFSRPAAIL